MSEKKTHALDGLLQRVWRKSDAINRNLENNRGTTSGNQIWKKYNYKKEVEIDKKKFRLIQIISIPINLGGDGAFVREKDRGANEGKDRGWADSNFIISKCLGELFQEISFKLYYYLEMVWNQLNLSNENWKYSLKKVVSRFKKSSHSNFIIWKCPEFSSSFQNWCLKPQIKFWICNILGIYISKQVGEDLRDFIQIYLLRSLWISFRSDNLIFSENLIQPWV